MYDRNYNDCDKCHDCMKHPGEDHCNIACPSTEKNCYESRKVFTPCTYAKANIALQPYENLFCIEDAFEAGTVFKDLYSPYCDIKYLRKDDKK